MKFGQWLKEARKLNAKQKKLLDALSSDIFSWDDIPQNIRNQLEKINDYETLWSDAQRYISDKNMGSRAKSGGFTGRMF